MYYYFGVQEERMEHPPDDNNASEPEIRDGGGKPQGYDAIYPRLKSVRKRALRELYKRDGEASSTILKAADGAAIPEGSFEMHIAWLRGKRRNGDAHPWWPEDAEPLIEMLRKDDLEYGPTRIFGLTEYGERFVRYMTAAESDTANEALEEVRMAVQGHGEQIDRMSREIEGLKENVTSESRRGVSKDRVDRIEDELSDLSDRINRNENGIHKILDHIEG